jgi:hypothetical protein
MIYIKKAPNVIILDSILGNCLALGTPADTILLLFKKVKNNIEMLLTTIKSTVASPNVSNPL